MISCFIESTSENEEEGENFDDYLYRKTKEFNEKTQRNPNDIQLWKEFVKLQDELLQLGKKQTPAGVIEKKISIYRKALDQNPDSIELLVGMLQEGAILWDSEKTLSMWRKVMKDHKHQPEMWKEYIGFLQTSFSSFSVSSMREIYAEALQTLHSILRQSLTKNEMSTIHSLELSLLDIFFLSCLFEKQAGYIEKSIACFQGLIELNFFCPQDMVSIYQQLKSFEAFWDSEAPRIGDQVNNNSTLLILLTNFSKGLRWLVKLVKRQSK